MSKITITNRFATTPNALLNDSTISLKAKGLYGYIQSKPEDWDFTISKIASQCKEGEEAIRSACKELQESGWLTIVNFQNEKGQWDSEYTLNSIQTDPVKPLVGSAGVGKSGIGKPLVISNIYIEKKISKKDQVKKANSKIKNFDSEKYIKNLDLEPTVSLALLDLIEVRKCKRTATTQKAIDLIIQNLDKWHPDDYELQKRAIEKSIMNGWAGVFEFQEHKQNNFSQNNQQKKSAWVQTEKTNSNILYETI